jgi:4-hydroxy 2-oxovalerate aldolase
MNNLQIFDSTLRDGSHAIKHRLSAENIIEYCKYADNAGFYTIIVGHGNGLGASSLQVGVSALSDKQMLTIARSNLSETKLGVFLITGFGTIHDDIMPAIDLGVDLVCVASHCTEADVTKQHIEFVRKNGKEAYGILMMYHMASRERLLEEALKMQSYGALGVILMDSAGASTPKMVSDCISLLSSNLSIKVGFHAHNNLGLAVSNSLLAVESGASIIDGTVRGFGAGAGNCPLEVFAGLLYKMQIKTGLDLYRTMDLSEEVVKKIMTGPQEITSAILISGIAGVFSAFLPHVMNAANRFNLDPRDIFLELGRRKVVGGQEDIIVDVAMELSERKKTANYNYEIESLM